MKQIVLAGTNETPDQIEKDNRALAREAAAEGFVLLKNDDVLPLKEKKIALYGSGARMTVKGGTGSGAVRERYSVSIEKGLLDAGVEISTENWLDRFDAYYKKQESDYNAGIEEKVKGMKQFYQILGVAVMNPFVYPTGIPVEDADVTADADAGVDTAVYVLARQAGEGADRKDVPGDYGLDEVEKANLQKVSESYKNLIVIVNAGGAVDLSFMDTLHVSALVYFCQGGEEGGNALADVLTGKKNFSGKLATSWAYAFSDLPSNKTYSYLGSDEHQQEYNEGIYVGYRYFDTFGVTPRFPFGYGLSYTSFAVSLTDLRQNGRRLEADVTVKNTGKRSGKEVVQLYASVPFGKNGAEAKRLVAFAKTSLLDPGESETVTLQFPVDALTKYDEEQSAYVLEKGVYILRVGNSSDNVTPAAAVRVHESILTEQCEAICPVQHEIDEIIPPAGKADLAEYAACYEAGCREIDLDLSEIKTITHEYKTPDVYSGRTDDPGIRKVIDSMDAKDLSALVCGGGTQGNANIVLSMGASGTTTGALYEKYGIPNVTLSDGPAGLNLTPVIVEKEDGTFSAARVPQVLEAYKKYLFGFAGMALKSQMADPKDGTVHYQYATAWPCSQLLAQTWNTDLLYKVGDGTGKEMEKFGVTVWLAPGMNIHRNPLCGRTFEYYSEDPLVSGKMAAAIVRGVQSHPGKGMSIKHFVANNCELNRNSSSSNMTERTLRELYLKGFEIAVKEANPMTVMGSYNLVNGTYVNNSYDLLTKVLRNEWGFKGLVMSDWDSITCEQGQPMKAKTGDILKAAAAECDLVMPGRPDQIEALTEGVKDGSVDLNDLRRSATRVLYMIRQNTILPVKE